MPGRKKQLGKPKPKKLYTFNVLLSFSMQHTFREDEVEQAFGDGGDKDDFEPTTEALQQLEGELDEYLSQNYVVKDVDAYAEFDSLLGINDDEP